MTSIIKNITFELLDQYDITQTMSQVVYERGATSKPLLICIGILYCWVDRQV